MRWVTVFTVENQPAFDIAGVLFPSLFFLIGLALAALPVSPQFGFGGWGRRAFGLLFAALGGALAIIDVGSGYVAHASQLDALHTGKANVAEGAVTNFRPMPESGHGHESLDVAGQHFEYSDFEYSGGFNTSSTYGGPIHSGQRVRITYAHGDILKLEIESKG